MEIAVPNTQVLCSQCGGELHPDVGQIFLTCPYCTSAIYLDKSQVVFHWYLAPTLDQSRAQAALARWMAGNATVKNLDQKSRVTEVTFEYFPVWYFKQRNAGGAETVYLQPAAATSVSVLKDLRLPAGDLKKYDPGIDAQAHTPSVPLETAVNWLVEEEHVPVDEFNERFLVHIPLFTFKYSYQGKVYTAVVEAGTGAVLANIFPAKAEAPFIMAGAASATVFLCLALIPIVGSVADDVNGFGIGLLICSGLGIAAAPILFALASWVAAKV